MLAMFWQKKEVISHALLSVAFLKPIDDEDMENVAINALKV